MKELWYSKFHNCIFSNQKKIQKQTSLVAIVAELINSYFWKKKSVGIAYFPISSVIK